jgi:acetyl-CoA carboxylase carboxyltransferase component
MQPNFMFSWPHARVGVASSQHMGNGLTDLDSEYASSAMIHDDIILPSETRKVRVKCLLASMLIWILLLT